MKSETSILVMEARWTGNMSFKWVEKEQQRKHKKETTTTSRWMWKYKDIDVLLLETIHSLWFIVFGNERR